MTGSWLEGIGAIALFAAAMALAVFILCAIGKVNHACNQIEELHKRRRK